MNSRMFFPVVLALLVITTAAQAAPITFNTALPVAKGGVIVRGQYLRRSFVSDPTHADRDLDVKGFVSVAGYGVTRKFAMFGALPYLDKSLRMVADGQRVHRSSWGFGDLKLFGRYTLYQQDAKRRTIRVGAFAGVKVPTGKDDQEDRFGRLPIPLQSGSGAWGGLAGVVATWQVSDFEVDAQLGYEASNEANDFEAGDVLRADVSLQYRLLPGTIRSSTRGFLYGVLEVSALDQSRNRVAGAPDSDSGGTTVYLTPGVQYVTPKFILETAVQVPVYQNLNGRALETDYVFSAGFRVNL